MISFVLFKACKSFLCADEHRDRSLASEKRTSRAASLQPEGTGIATLAGQAQKVRLDSLYELLSAAGIDTVQEEGYSTLTRRSLDKVFDCLIDRHGFSGEWKSHLLQMQVSHLLKDYVRWITNINGLNE